MLKDNLNQPATKKDIYSLRKEMATKDELKGEIQSVRNDLANESTKINNRIDNFRL